MANSNTTKTATKWDQSPAEVAIRGTATWDELNTADRLGVWYTRTFEVALGDRCLSAPIGGSGMTVLEVGEIIAGGGTSEGAKPRRKLAVSALASEAFESLLDNEDSMNSQMEDDVLDLDPDGPQFNKSGKALASYLTGRIIRVAGRFMYDLEQRKESEYTDATRIAPGEGRTTPRQGISDDLDADSVDTFTPGQDRRGLEESKDEKTARKLSEYKAGSGQVVEGTALGSISQEDADRIAEEYVLDLDGTKQGKKVRRRKFATPQMLRDPHTGDVTFLKEKEAALRLWQYGFSAYALLDALSVETLVTDMTEEEKVLFASLYSPERQKMIQKVYVGIVRDRLPDYQGTEDEPDEHYEALRSLEPYLSAHDATRRRAVCGAAYGTQPGVRRHTDAIKFTMKNHDKTHAEAVALWGHCPECLDFRYPIRECATCGVPFRAWHQATKKCDTHRGGN